MRGGQLKRELGAEGAGAGSSSREQGVEAGSRGAGAKGARGGSRVGSWE